MKKRFISVFLSFVFSITILLPFRICAHADALSAGVLAGTAYMMGQQLGYGFAMSGLSSSQVEIWMTDNINTYAAQQQQSIGDLFGEAVYKDLAGKVVIGHITYNAISDFLGWLKDKYNLTSAIQSLNEMIGEYSIGVGRIESGEFNYAGWSAVNVTNGGYWQIQWVDENGVISGSRASVSNNQYPIFSGIRIRRTSAKVLVADAYYTNSLGGEAYQSAAHTFNNPIVYGTVSGSFEETAMPTVLGPSKEWYGGLNGYDDPDTNLEQLMGQVFQDVADTNLDVEGEIRDIDPPVPPPSPAPIDPDLPLSDVPWEGLDNNLQQLYEQGLEEIGTIGDARDAITEAVGEQTGALEGAIEDQTGALEGAIADNAGVVSGAIDQAVSDVGSAIGTQTGAISGAIDQAVSDVQTAIGEQTAALDESLSATAEGVETIVEAIEDEEINWRKFDLRGLFPFCIPFDIYNMLNALDASPVAPHVQLPFVIESIGFSYMLDLDFSAFDSVAAIMRQMELICYGLALAWATSKVIKW